MEAGNLKRKQIRILRNNKYSGPKGTLLAGKRRIFHAKSDASVLNWTIISLWREPHVWHPGDKWHIQACSTAMAAVPAPHGSPGASWGSSTCCWALGWPRSLSKESHDGEGTGTGSGPPLAPGCQVGHGEQQRGKWDSPSSAHDFSLEGISLRKVCPTAGHDLSQQVNVAWILGASQVWGPCWAFPVPAGFERKVSFQSPEFPQFLPLSRAASSATCRADSQGKSCCVPVPAPCTWWHFCFEAGHKLLHRLVTADPKSREGYCIKHFHTQGKPHGEDRAGTSIRMEKINSSHKSHTLENPISKEIRLVMIPCTQKWNEIPKLTCCTCFAFLSPRNGKTFLLACEKLLRAKQTLTAIPSQSPAVAGSTWPGRLLQIPFFLTA